LPDAIKFLRPRPMDRNLLLHLTIDEGLPDLSSGLEIGTVDE